MSVCQRWNYKEMVALSLVVIGEAVVVLIAAVYALGKLNEQWLRRQEFKHKEEMLVKDKGDSLFIANDTQKRNWQAEQQCYPFEARATREDEGEYN